MSKTSVKLAQWFALCFIMALIVGCSTSAPPRDPRMTELDADHAYIQREIQVLQSRKDLLDICKRARPYTKWDSCYELAGIER